MATNDREDTAPDRRIKPDVRQRVTATWAPGGGPVTIPDMSPPRVPSPVPPPAIDLDKLKLAWDANVETQRELVRVVEKTADDNEAVVRSNKSVKWMMLGVLLLATVGAWYLHLAARQAQADVAAMRGELRHMREVLDEVADGVAKHSAAQILAEENAASRDAVRRAREDAMRQFLQVQKSLSKPSSGPTMGAKHVPGPDAK